MPARWSLMLLPPWSPCHRRQAPRRPLPPAMMENTSDLAARATGTVWQDRKRSGGAVDAWMGAGGGGVGDGEGDVGAVVQNPFYRPWLGRWRWEVFYVTMNEDSGMRYLRTFWWRTAINLILIFYFGNWFVRFNLFMQGLNWFVCFCSRTLRELLFWGV